MIALLKAAGRWCVREELAGLRLRVAALEGITDSLEEELKATRTLVDECHRGPGVVEERGRYG